MDNIIELMRSAGVPASMVVGVLITLLILERFKLLGRRASNKSDRELLTAAETEFRQAILTRLQVSEARGDASEKDRAQMRVDLDACEKRHAEAEKTFKTALNEMRDELAACERRHQDIAERNENLEHSYAQLTRSYQTIADQLTKLLALLRAQGADFLFELGGPEIAEMPASVDALLADIPPERRAYTRRQQSNPTDPERRLAERRKP